jgi:hypothetical protein
MPRSAAYFLVLFVACFLAVHQFAPIARAEAVALWLFDEQNGLYPSCLIADAATNKCPLVLGRGGQIVEG